MFVPQAACIGTHTLEVVGPDSKDSLKKQWIPKISLIKHLTFLDQRKCIDVEFPADVAFQG